MSLTVCALLVALLPLAFCLGWGAAAEAMAREIRAGAVEIDGRRYLCYLSALPAKNKKHKR